MRESQAEESERMYWSIQHDSPARVAYSMVFGAQGLLTLSDAGSIIEFSQMREHSLICVAVPGLGRPSYSWTMV